MRIALLHLSDLHFKEQKNVIAFRKEKIAGALRSLGHFGATFLVVSGDVTYSGQRKQYDEAFDFFVALQDEITCDRTLGAVHFVAVPGNHDCDLSKDSQAREILIANVLRSAVELTDPSVVDNLTSIQDDFFSFLEVMTGNKPSGIQRINYHFTFEVDDRRIFFDCYNTAWMLGKDQGPNQVILPLQSLSESQSLSGSDLNCAVFHHPYVWFKLENGRQFRKRIENSCQVVLTGHEHDVSQVAQKRISGEVNEYLEGGILQSDSEYESSFNIQTIDLDQHQSQCLQFNWEEDIYKSAKQSSPVSLRTSKLARAFQNDLEFEEWLNDPEIDFVSKNREQTKLEDIYVYPDLRVLDPERISLGMPHVTISGDKLAEYILTSERVITLVVSRMWWKKESACPTL